MSTSHLRVNKMEKDWGPEIDSTVSAFTAAFLSLEQDNPKLIGSGTFVKSGTIEGVLTCAHVAELISEYEEFGIVCFPIVDGRRQRITVPALGTVSEKVEMAQKPWSEFGPDLSFIPLPPDQMSTIKSLANVADLNIGFRKLTSDLAVDATQKFECVSGAVASMTPPPRVSVSLTTLNVNGLVNIGQIQEIDTHNGFDRLKIVPIPHSEFILPESYGGMSGGGVWRVYVKNALSEKPEIVECHLVGTAYWQTDAPNRSIIAHGSSSLYLGLLKKIREKWPKAAAV